MTTPKTEAGKRHARWLAFGNDLDGAHTDEIVAEIEAQAVEPWRKALSQTITHAEHYECEFVWCVEARSLLSDNPDSGKADPHPFPNPSAKRRAGGRP